MNRPTRCGIHNTPTGPVRRCSSCDRCLPYWHELEPRRTLADSQWCDLRVDNGDFRLWTSRMSVADGDPYPHTVYVETLDPERGWIDLGHYDGDNPPRSLPGCTHHAFRGDLIPDRRHTP